MKKKDFFIIFLIVLLFVFGVYYYFNNDNTRVENDVISDLENQLEVHYIDVGQGDSTLIKVGDNAMLIDGGTNEMEKRVIDYLKAQNIKKLDYVIATHPHEDHIGGLDGVINTFNTENIIMPKVTHTTKSFEDLLDSIENNNLKITPSISGDRYKLGDSEFLIIGPNSKEYKNLNNYSVSIKLDYKNTSFIFTGDAEKISEDEMLEKYSTYLSADVLKLGHHGSNTSTSKKFLEAVDPAIAVASAGKGNKYNHPNKEVLERLEKRDIIVLDTINHSNIILKSDGDKITMENGSHIEAKDDGLLSDIINIIEYLVKSLSK